MCAMHEVSLNSESMRLHSIIRFEIILQIRLMPDRFSDIVTTKDKEFLAVFTPSFVKKTIDQPRGARKVNICSAY